jgi:hypothetical protein
MERGKEIIAKKHAVASSLMVSSGQPYTSVARSEEEPCITFRIRTPPWPVPSLGTAIDFVESDRWDYALNGRSVKLEEDGIELNCEVSNIKWQIVIEPKEE